MKDVFENLSGAQFYWADLHIHTPEWRDFKLPSGCKTDDEMWRKDFAKRYVSEALKKGITIIGVTEHNDVSWVDDIRAVAENDFLAVFPGFEITANTGGDGVHLVCLFDCAKPSSELDDLLTYFGLPRGRRFTRDRTPIIADKSFEDIIKKVEEEIADIVIYCLSACNSLGIDLSEAVRDKLAKNAAKYPVSKAKGTAKKYTEL